MPKQQLTCDTLGDLDNGMVRALINHVLDKVAQDLEDRGADLKPRKTTIVIEQKRIHDGKIVTTVEVDASVPKLRSHDTLCELRLRNDGKEPAFGSFFQPMNAERDDQPTLIGKE